MKPWEKYSQLKPWEKYGKSEQADLPVEQPRPEVNLDPTAMMSPMERFNAGMGAGVTNLALGGKQALTEYGNTKTLGQMLSPQQQMTLLARGDDLSRKLIPDSAVSDVQTEVDQKRAIDAALNNTTAGKVGNVAGTVLATIPAAMIPGANTYTGSALTGAALGALQPTAEGESRAANTALGAALSIPGKYVADKLSAGAAALIDKTKTTLAAKQAQNAVRDASLKAGQEAGYAVPPSMANNSIVNRVLEGIPGKAGIAQSASLKNQEVTNSLARKSLGLADDVPITEESLKALRAEAGKAYQVLKDFPGRFKADTQFADDIARIGSDFSEAANEFPELVKNDAIESLKASLNKPDVGPKATVELIKKLRFDATKNLKSFDDPAKAALGQAQRAAADALDGLMERNISASNPAAAQAYKQARTLIAKSYDVEAALNESTGNVSAKVLARAYEKGKPISGELETIARFSRAFPKATQTAEPLSGVLGGTPLDAALGGAAAFGSEDPRYLALALLRPTLRAGIMSKAGQYLLAQPSSYGVPLSTKSLGLLGNPYVQKGIQSALPAGLLNQ